MTTTLPNTLNLTTGPARSTRTVVYRSRGQRHGPIVRLVSPSDVGERIKPFVFLDHVNIEVEDSLGFGFHPHSGIATLTLTLKGGFAYEDSTGEKGVLHEGAVEWMRAGGGVWHRGHAVGDQIMGYQLWIALGPDLESSSPFSQYLEAEAFGKSGPARVVLGEVGGVKSPIAAPHSMNYLDVRMTAGQTWEYQPPDDHDVLWIAVHRGRLLTPSLVDTGELVVFEESSAPVTFQATDDVEFVLGSARKHPHPLVLGHYSVHTTPAALRKGEEEIRRVGTALKKSGKL